jgi:hypothetical protein
MGVIDELKALDEKRQELMAGATKDLLARGHAVVEELKALGHHFSFGESKSLSTKKTKSTTATKRVMKGEPCKICGFKTTPPHDARLHRGQKTKKPLTAHELAEKGLAKV